MQGKEKRQAFLSQFPQINSVQMKSGNINRPENLGCAPLTPKMCLSSLKQYLVRERADSTRSESASSSSAATGNRAQMVVEAFLFLPFIIFISMQFLSALKLPTAPNTKNTIFLLPHKSKESSKYSHLRSYNYESRVLLLGKSLNGQNNVFSTYLRSQKRQKCNQKECVFWGG